MRGCACLPHCAHYPIAARGARSRDGLASAPLPATGRGAGAATRGRLFSTDSELPPLEGATEGAGRCGRTPGADRRCGEGGSLSGLTELGPRATPTSWSGPEDSAAQQVVACGAQGASGSGAACEVVGEGVQLATVGRCCQAASQAASRAAYPSQQHVPQRGALLGVLPLRGVGAMRSVGHTSRMCPVLCAAHTKPWWSSNDPPRTLNAAVGVV